VTTSGRSDRTSPRPGRGHPIRLVPPVLAGCAVVLLLGALVIRWRDWPAVAMLAAYLGWLLAELPVTLRRPPGIREVATLLPYALARLATIAATGYGPARPDSRVPAVLCAGLFVAGVGLREAAIATLGRWYSHHVALRRDQVAVTTGPFRLVRHPAYAGMLLAHLGFVGFFAAPLGVLGLLGLGLAVIWRIRVEERVLLDRMPGYPQYAAGRARLLPGVW
jgi:protein-S-isoprenylcysteine O-methyltransferase Ste14